MAHIIDAQEKQVMKLAQQVIDSWSREYGDDERDAATYKHLRTEMTDDERASVGAAIATRQMEDDQDAECVDCGLVQRELMDAGFHPAFELAGVDGEGEFQALRAQRTSEAAPR
jgi:hypothetical protein